MIKIVVIEHQGWPERRSGHLIPGLHEIPQANGVPLSIVSLDNGEIHAVPSASVYTPEGLAYVEEWAVKAHRPLSDVRVPKALMPE